MKKLNKFEVLFLGFFLFTTIGYCMFYNNLSNKEIQKSYSLIWNHIFVICLILFSTSLHDNTFTILLGRGIIIYKIELIIYNFVLIFIDKDHYNSLNTSYDVVMILTGTIFIVVLIAKFFDKICIIFNKIIRWISK